MVAYVFKRLQDFLALAEMTEEKLQGSWHERWVVMHDEMEEDSEEHPPAVFVQIQPAALQRAVENPLRLRRDDVQVDQRGGGCNAQTLQSTITCRPANISRKS